MKIKKANEEDKKAVSRVYVDSWRTTYHGLVPDDYLDSLSYKEAEQRWLHFLNHEHEAFIYIAVNNAGNIIGFASGKSMDDENFDGELYSLYLLQKCRGLGIGRQLVSAIANHFKEKGFTSIMVWVEEKNKDQLDQIATNDSLWEKFANIEDPSQLTDEAVDEMIQILEETIALYEIKVNFQVDGKAVTLKDLMKMEKPPGSFSASIYDISGNLLMDLTIPKEFFENLEAVEEGEDLLHLGEISDDYVDHMHKEKYENAQKELK